MRQINVGIIGFGTVGSGVVKALISRRQLLREKLGIDINLKKICDKDIFSDRGISVNKGLLTKDAKSLINDPQIDIIVELIGGIHPAKEFIIKALKKGKHVVTANKLLLAEEGKRIFKIAKEEGREIYFEASVGGGIPIVRSIREGLVANRFLNILGIINGTSNFILSKMTDEGINFEEALLKAKQKGYAEKDPSLDIEGWDSAHKLIILCVLGFGRWVDLKEIYVEGISKIRALDIAYASELGYVIKLLAIAKAVNGKLEARVHPTLLPKTHLLSSVSGNYNAIYVSGDLVGEQILYGEGAGRFPASSAVVSDIADIALKIAGGANFYRREPDFKSNIKRVCRMDEVKTKYYIRFSVIDRPGVLARIAHVLGSNGISIASVVQKERRQAKAVPVVMLTHEAKENSVQLALKEIDRLSVVKERSVVLRMER